MSGWRGWIGTIAAGAVLAELAQSLAPEGWRERIGRIAALAVLASLVVWISAAAGAGEKIGEAASELFRSGGADPENAGSGREAWIGTAEFVFSYLGELGLDADGAEVTVTEEEDGTAGILVTVPRCPYAERMRIEEELGGALGIPVRAETGGAGTGKEGSG